MTTITKNNYNTQQQQQQQQQHNNKTTATTMLMGVSIKFIDEEKQSKQNSKENMYLNIHVDAKFYCIPASYSYWM